MIRNELNLNREQEHLRKADDAFVPTLSLLVAILLGILNFFVLIYFINMIAKFVQVNYVIETISNDISNSITRQFPEAKFESKKNPEDSMVPDFSGKELRVIAKKSGYIQTINYERIVKNASRNDIYIRFLKRPGPFVNEGLPLLNIYSKRPVPKKLINSLLRSVKLDIRRSTTQDIEFGFEELAEIAIRALSPSVYDPFTAINCLERMSIPLILLSYHEIPLPYYRDDGNEVRLSINPFTYEGIVNIAFDRFRQDAVKDISVSLKMLEIINKLGEFDLRKTYRLALHKQANLIMQGCSLQRHLPSDKEEIRKLYLETINKLLAHCDADN